MIKIIKCFIISFLFFITLFSNTSVAQEVLKINSINFDNSDSIIYIGTSGLSNTTPLAVEKGKLSNPDRIYFDIKNAILTKPNNPYELKNSVLSQVKLAQYSVNPPVVRIVISYDPSFNPDNLKVLKNNNNLIIKINNATPIQDYLTQIYREISENPYDYIEKTTITTQNGAPKPTLITTAKPTPASAAKPATPPKVQSNNDLFNQIEKAFNDNTSQLSAEAVKNTQKIVPKEPEPVRKNPPIKESKLKSRYFINRVEIKKGNILISGIGVVNIEKFIYLSEPSRVVFDLPNTVIEQDLRGKEFKINETESMKIGQFEANKARIVVQTPTPEKYRPIYAFDLQNILIAHDDRMAGVKLFNTTTDISGVSAKRINNDTEILTLDFSSPVVQSFKRDNSKVELNFYNAVWFDNEGFKNCIKNTRMANSKIERLPYQGLKITIPIKKESFVEAFENLSATQLKLTIKTPIVKTTCPIQQPPPSGSLSGRIIVLDPGHGGSDTGALRAGINEKDLTLDIAKKVAAILTNKGARVEMTRWNDATVSLQERVEFSNTKNTAIYVSIHINSSVRPEVHGIETHYYTDPGFEVAKVLHKSIMSKVSGTDRGLFKSRFYVINHTEAPSVLLELGFISNDNERNALLTEDRQQKSAEAIAEGIMNYLNSRQKR